MRHFMVLVTVVVLTTAMLVAGAAPALARPLLDPCQFDPTCPPREPPRPPRPGTALPALVCETPAVVAPNIGWRNGQCWVFHPVAS